MKTAGAILMYFAVALMLAGCYFAASGRSRSLLVDSLIYGALWPATVPMAVMLNITQTRAEMDARNRDRW